MAEEDKKEELKNRLESSINEDDSGNYAGALGFELGVGLAADWLVASPDPLSRGLSFGIGYGANVIAQKIRGNEEFSHGEALAAGGFQAIPFGTTAKGLKGIGRATAKGAAIGVGGEQVRTAIDEQRLLTPGEALTAGTLGAGFGGTIKFGTESADILIRQARANRLSRQGKFWRQPGFDPESPNPIPNPWEDGKTFNRVDTTNREARRQTEIRLGVLNRIRMQIDNPKPPIGPGALNPNQLQRFNWRDLNSDILWRAANTDNRIISKVQSHIDMLDDWRLSHTDLDRPMTGYLKEHGKPTFWAEGKEWIIGWSRTKGTYEIDDLQKRIDRRASRLAGDKTSNPESASLRAIKEAFKRDLNKQAAELPIEQWDIMIQNPGDAYVEHLIAVKSPFWKTQRGKNAGYLAGDSRNLKVLTDQNFKKLKDNVERHVHAKHKNLYVDYDPISQNLVLKDLQTSKALKTQIPGIGEPSQARAYVADAIEGRPMRSIIDINPKTPANIQRQIDRTYFVNTPDIVKEAIIDRIRGKSWNKIRQEYGSDFTTRQLRLATDKYNKLTRSQVIAIMNAYKIGGKGRTKY